jgi:hypothetical protein
MSKMILTEALVAASLRIGSAELNQGNVNTIGYSSTADQK